MPEAKRSVKSAAHCPRWACADSPERRYTPGMPSEIPPAPRPRPLTGDAIAIELPHESWQALREIAQQRQATLTDIIRTILLRGINTEHHRR